VDGDDVDPPRDPRRSHVLVRFVLLRLLGLVYLTAFATAVREVLPLIGDRGLLPASRMLAGALEVEGSSWAVFRKLPTLFVLTGASDTALYLVAALGAVLSAAVLGGVTNAGVMVALWALYLSLSNVGQTFWSFGWEIQILETGLLAAFLCPWRTVRPFPPHPPPLPSVWLFRWLIVRIMLGAGLIKLRGDPCWVELTCLVHHYETQPNPSYASWLLHAMPRWFHQGGVLFNHAVELIAPIAAFGPRPARLVAGVLFIVFQITLIVSGNLSFLNWLTLVPAIACLDDAALRRVLPRRLVAMAEEGTTARAPSRAALLGSIAWMLVVAVLSLQVVGNLLSPRQAMNRSFDPFHLVNTYGAFGSVGADREEIILEGTSDASPGEGATWREYVLPCKPGPVDRAPCQITPLHLRLDWQMWFLPFGEVENAPWLVHLVAKLLEGDPTPKKLLSVDPFPDAPPRWIRATRWRYHMVPYGEGAGVWWRRERVGEFMRPMRKDDPDLGAYLRGAGLR
jgi:hypothetical protein